MASFTAAILADGDRPDELKSATAVWRPNSAGSSHWHRPPGTEDEWAIFDGPELDDKTRELEIAGRRIEAAVVGATGRAARTAHFQRDGHRSVTSWLMATTNCSHREANARRQSAEALRALSPQ